MGADGAGRRIAVGADGAGRRTAVGADGAGRQTAGIAVRPGSGDASQVPPGDTLGFLHGHWDVARQIFDYRSGHSGTFRGKASFVPEPPGPLRPEPERRALTYREHGELRFGRHHGPARRSLVYLARDDGGADVQFADGRAFYRLDLSSGDWRAEHPCRDDTYLVTVRTLSPDSFAETWRVVGPAKDYAMTATYSRALCQ